MRVGFVARLIGIATAVVAAAVLRSAVGSGFILLVAIAAVGTVAASTVVLAVAVAVSAVGRRGGAIFVERVEVDFAENFGAWQCVAVGVGFFGYWGLFAAAAVVGLGVVVGVSVVVAILDAGGCSRWCRVCCEGWWLLSFGAFDGGSYVFFREHFRLFVGKRGAFPRLEAVFGLFVFALPCASGELFRFFFDVNSGAEMFD